MTTVQTIGLQFLNTNEDSGLTSQHTGFGRYPPWFAYVSHFIDFVGPICNAFSKMFVLT